MDRRRFLAQLGRNTFAVAILGSVATACSDDDSSGPGPASGPPTSPAASSPRSATTVRSTFPSSPSVSSRPTGEAVGDDVRWEQVSLGFVSAYVLVRGNTAAVVDTGTPGSSEAIGESLGLLGVTFDDVRHVVLTHKHPDHIGSLSDVIERSPTATRYAGAGDLEAIGAEAVAVYDGDDVLGLQVIETPGHTPGSIALFDPGIGLLVAGDALRGSDDGDAVIGPDPDFTDDMAVARASIDKLADLDVRAAVFGHGQPVHEGAGVLIRGLV